MKLLLLAHLKPSFYFILVPPSILVHFLYNTGQASIEIDRKLDAVGQ